VQNIGQSKGALPGYFITTHFQMDKPRPVPCIAFEVAARSSPRIATEFFPFAKSIADDLDTSRLRPSANVAASLVKTCTSCESRETETYAKQLFQEHGS
jgi:hypothetical protein